MGIRTQIIFYSAHGQIYKMAKAIEQGVRDVEGAEVCLYRLPELGPDDCGAARAGFGHVPIAQPERLADADAIFFGTPTRFGNMCAPMRLFIDSAAPLWFRGALIGKVGSVFVSSASQHGGQETTILTLMAPMLHLGMILVGVPYSTPELFTTQGGGSPYGPGHVAGDDNRRQIDEHEAAICRALGRRLAVVGLKLQQT